MAIVFIIAIGQALFLAFFLLSRKKISIGNGLFSLLLFAIAFSLFIKYSYEVELVRVYPFLLGLDSGIPFLYGPILWLYAALILKERDIGIRDSIHLIPFAGQYIFMFFFLYGFLAEEKIAFYEAMLGGFMPESFLIANMIKAVHALVYFLLTISLINRSQRKSGNIYSEFSDVDFSWLRSLTIAAIPFPVLKGLVTFSFYFPGTIPHQLSSTFLDLGLFVLIFVVAYTALSKPELFRKNRGDKSVKYAESVIDALESKKLFEQLKELMGTEVPFLKPDLSVNELANQISIKPKVLSQVINENGDTNFFMFINHYRVEHFKKEVLKEENKHFTLIAIAEKCGFSSKATFNSVFKKIEGKTPSQFLNQTDS